MIYLEKDNLEDYINDGVTLVDFYAEWCGPCKLMSAVLGELDNEYSIIKVDTDKFKNLTTKYRIMSIPTILVFKNKEKFKEIIGYHTKEELEKLIED